MTLSTLPVLALVVVVLGAIGLTRRSNSGRWLATATFSVYLVGLAHFVILPLTFDPHAAAVRGPIPTLRGRPTPTLANRRCCTSRQRPLGKR